jgi:hypothetical protein
MNWTLFFTVLAAVESDNNPDKIGDAHLRHPAYGIYQIRQPMLTDVGKLTGSYHQAEHVAHRPDIADWAIQVYIKHWVSHYGLRHTYENYARIHNGGPRGWERESTLPFWRKFETELKKHERGNK